MNKPPRIEIKDPPKAWNPGQDAINREVAPVQTHHSHFGGKRSGVIPWDMHMRAYEVYQHIYSPQHAMTEGMCRGGFGMQELLSLLYARTFPKDKWRERFEACFKHMEGF